MFYFFYSIIWMLAWLPMGVLYVVSDLLYPLVYYVVGYRKKVVRKNLTRAFPDKSLQQVLQIERRFYRYLCDLMLESIWQLHATKSEMRRRMTFENLELLTDNAKEGKSSMLMTAHYGNWEWTSVMCTYLSPEFKAYPVYQRLQNKHFDKLMLQLRNRYGAVSVEKDELVRTMIRLRNNGIQGLFGMVSDQSPRARFIRYRMEFLNQDTPVFLGTEQLAKKYNYPVYYLDIQRVKRGYYHAIIRPIAVSPSDTLEFEITTAFMQQLEKNIQEKPEFWLWSHNRWKHSKTPVS